MGNVLKNIFLLQWGLVCLGLVAVGGMIVNNIFQTHSYVVDQERVRLLTQARVITENLASQLAGTDRALALLRDDLARRPDNSKYLPETNRLLTTLVATNPGIRTMIVTDSAGQARLSNREEVIGLDLSERPYFQLARERTDPGILFLTPPYKTVLGSWLMNLVRVIPGPHGGFAGVVLAGLDPEYFKTLMNSVNYAPDMWTSMAHGDGTLFMMVPEREGQAGMNLAQPGSFFTRHRETGSRENVLTGIVYSTGEERMMALSTLRSEALPLDKTLVVAVSRDLAAITESWRRDALIHAGIFLVVVLGSFLALVAYQRRQRAHIRQAELAEAQLRESADRLNLATATAGLGIWEYHPTTRRMIWDAGMFTLYNVDPTASTSMYEIWRDCLIPDDLARAEGEIQDALAGLKSFNTEFRIRRRDGEIRVIEGVAQVTRDTLGSPTRMVGINIDITERRKAEDLVKHLASFPEWNPNIVLETDLKGGVNYCNPSALDWFPDLKERGTAHPFLAGWLEIIERITRGEETIHTREVQVADSFFLQSIHYLLEMRLIRMYAFDISDRHAAEELSHQAKETAEAANRAKSEFLANMSHEIRTPMNAIMGLTQLALESGVTPEQRSYLSKIKASSSALLGIINDILDYSKVEAGKLDIERVPLNLEDILRDVSNLFLPRIEEIGLELFIEMAPDVPLALIGDPLRLGQVLNNLIGNAVKFTHKGEIHVQVEIAEIDDRAVAPRFSVRDTGIGISRDQVERLFQPFTQADGSITRRYGGTGLGLTISRALVELMGGTLSVASALDRGSTFTFTARLDLPAEQPRPPLDQQLKGLRTLVVDDRETSLTILRQILESWGGLVTTLNAGREAAVVLERAESAGQPFELLLLDWLMPDLDGLETARLLETAASAGLLKRPPTIIMVTAQAREKLILEARSTRWDDILTKPVTPTRLLGSIIKTLTHSQLPPDFEPALDVTPYDLATPIRGARVLLVEDNELNQEVAREFLEKAGLVVTIATDGREGVNWAGRARFDAVLMDLQMPEMDGFQASRLIRSLPGGRSLPIIAMTAAAMTRDKVATSEAGMNDHIAKPINPRELLTTLLKWIKPGHPAEPSPPPPPQPGTMIPFPGIPGLEPQEVSARLGGNLTMFHNLLGRFLERFGDAVALTRADLAQDRREEAAQRLHALRGVAGNLSATRVAALCSQAEEAIRESKEGEATTLLTLLDTSMERLSSEARNYLATLPGSEADGQDVPTQAIPDEKTWTDLVVALEAQDLKALEQFARLRPILKTMLGIEITERISKDIEGLRFDRAASLLRLYGADRAINQSTPRTADVPERPKSTTQ